MRYIEDSGLNRLYHHLSNPNEVTIFISMDRSESTQAQNNKKRADFKKIMDLYHFGYFKVKGGYSEKDPITGDLVDVKDEASFTVFAPREKEDALLFLMLELGRLSKQDSVMLVKDLKAYWVSCPKQRLDTLLSSNDNIFDQLKAMGSVTSLGRFTTRNIEKFFTKIMGRKFSFSTAQVESVELKNFERSWERGFIYGLQEHLKMRKVDYDLRNLLGLLD